MRTPHLQQNKAPAHRRIESNSALILVLFNVKMRKGRHDPSKNIDIQGVIAKGFAGPRLIPSVDLR